MTILELKELIADLPDNMPVLSMEDEEPTIFVADYEDIPDGFDKPEPALIIEF